MIVKFLKAACFLIILLYGRITYSQTIINYQTWTPPSTCNIFSSSINVNGIPHKSIKGQPVYNSTHNAVSLKCIDQGAADWGTEYRINYNFVQGHKYRVIVNAMSINGPAGSPCPASPPSPFTYNYPPGFGLQPNSSAIAGNSDCNGVQKLDNTVFNFTLFQWSLIFPTNFADYTFDSQVFSQSYNYLNFAVGTLFASCYQYQEILIRKVTIIEITDGLFTNPLSSRSYCVGNSVTVPYSSSGIIFNTGNVFTAQLSNASGSFSSPVNIGTLASTSTSGNINGTIPANTTPGSGYRIRVVGSNPATTGSNNGADLVIMNNVLQLLSSDTITFILIDPTFGRIHAQIEPIPNATSYNWYKNGSLVSTYHGTLAVIPISKTACDIEYDIAFEAVNACGTSLQVHKNAPVPCDNFYLISPNPASTDVSISAVQSKSANGTNVLFDEVRIYDMQGNLKKQKKFNKTERGNISITGLLNGTYFIEIINGNYKERKQLLIQK